MPHCQIQELRLEFFSRKARGVQYVHWVMHKCIMVKIGGRRNTRKVCKNQVNLSKTGWEIGQSKGEIIIFAKEGGNVLKQGGNREEVRNLWLMTKKKS